ncbi:MAG: PIG-L family deacetylase, partial [Candidatus Hydrogenedentes bacterium]|nr:PIG-L family deacetylase [Candidatus Hydrogenedentota bacterium]
MKNTALRQNRHCEERVLERRSNLVRTRLPFIRLIVVQALCMLLIGASAAAAPGELGTVALAQSLKDLGNDFRLMCVAAHPDDEDGATLAYYRMKYGVKTFAVIATRGEGGQNEIGPDLYQDLGVIRTREMMAAAAVEGAQLRFLDMPEFGFSKSIEETFERWGHEETLRRLVGLIREVKPHVIITHHGRMKDHGHHQAIGQVLEEAFVAANHPGQFPDLATKWGTWQVQRLYIRNWEGGSESVAATIHELDPVRGRTYAEIAAQALREHHSQGMTFFIDQLLTGRPSTYYDLVQSAAIPEDGVLHADAEYGGLFEGLPLPAPLPELMEPRGEVKSFRASSRQTLARAVPASEAVLPELLDLGQALRGLSQDADVADFAHEVNVAARIAAGLRLRARPSSTAVVPGQTIEVALTLEDFGAPDATAVTLRVADQEHTAALEAAQSVTWTAHVTVPAEQSVTLPPSQYLFVLDPFRPVFAAQADIELTGGARLNLEAPVTLEVAPPVLLSFPEEPYLLRTNGGRSCAITVLASIHDPRGAALDVQLRPRAPLEVQPLKFNGEARSRGEQVYLRAVAQAPADLAPGVYSVHARQGDSGQPAVARVYAMDFDLPENVRAGVISSYDTTLETTLQKLAIAHEMLDQPEAFTRLAEFTHILVDMRAYQYRPDLVANNGA